MHYTEAPLLGGNWPILSTYLIEEIGWGKPELNHWHHGYKCAHSRSYIAIIQYHIWFRYLIKCWTRCPSSGIIVYLNVIKDPTTLKS